MPDRKICVRTGAELIQLRHREAGCNQFVVEDGAARVTVQYTCPGNGYGRTRIHRVSNRLVEIFSGRTKLASGDTFAMEFVPAKGTTFFIQGQPQGAPVGDAEYFGMVLRIWLGPVPVDHQLKEALLGKS